MGKRWTTRSVNETEGGKYLPIIDLLESSGWVPIRGAQDESYYRQMMQEKTRNLGILQLKGISKPL